MADPAKKVPKKIVTLSETEYRQHANDDDGLCLACFEWTSGGCEPDAREYECEGCGQPKVYGAEECLLMGRLDFVGDVSRGGKASRG